MISLFCKTDFFIFYKYVCINFFIYINFLNFFFILVIFFLSFYPWGWNNKYEFIILGTLKKISIIQKKELCNHRNNYVLSINICYYVSRWVIYTETSAESIGVDDANARIRNMTTTFHGRWKFPKARKLPYGELHYSFSSEYRKYSGGDTTAFILFLFLSISLLYR